MTQKERAEERRGIRKAEIVQEGKKKKKEQDWETGVTLSMLEDYNYQ